MAGEVFEFTDTITCRVNSIEEVEKEFWVNPGWERAWQVWFNRSVPSVSTTLAGETAKKAVSVTYEVPVEKLEVEVGKEGFANVLMY